MCSHNEIIAAYTRDTYDSPCRTQCRLENLCGVSISFVLGFMIQSEINACIDQIIYCTFYRTGVVGSAGGTEQVC